MVANSEKKLPTCKVIKREGIYQCHLLLQYLILQNQRDCLLFKSGNTSSQYFNMALQTLFLFLKTLKSLYAVFIVIYRYDPTINVRYLHSNIPRIILTMPGWGLKPCGLRVHNHPLCHLSYHASVKMITYNPLKNLQYFWLERPSTPACSLNFPTTTHRT